MLHAEKILYRTLPVVVLVILGLHCNTQWKNITLERTPYVKCCYVDFLLNMSAEIDASYEIKEKKKPPPENQQLAVVVKLTLGYSVWLAWGPDLPAIWYVCSFVKYAARDLCLLLLLVGFERFRLVQVVLQRQLMQEGEQVLVWWLCHTAVSARLVLPSATITGSKW